MRQMMGLVPMAEFPQTLNFNIFVEMFTLDSVETPFRSTNTQEKLWQLSEIVELNKNGILRFSRQTKCLNLADGSKSSSDFDLLYCQKRYEYI